MACSIVLLYKNALYFSLDAEPGKSRILVINARNFMTQLSSGPEWWQLFPRWADHQMMLNLFDGDLALLHEQVSSLKSMKTAALQYFI